MIRVFGFDVVLRAVERDVSAVARANIADLTQSIVVPSHVLRNVRIGDRLERFVRGVDAVEFVSELAWQPLMPWYGSTE